MEQHANDTAIVVFSKDRAMQLDAGLRSLQACRADAGQADLSVLYACSTAEQEQQYALLAREHPETRFVREVNFHEDLLALLHGHRFALFLVDDNVFVQNWDLSDATARLDAHPDALAVSLRLGANTTYCYSLDAPQTVPAFEALDGDARKFTWTDAEHDFAYPFDVSSSLYRTEDLLPLLEGAPDIHNPNALETHLHACRAGLSGSKPALLCYTTSRAFCIPLNLVQHDSPNRTTASPSGSTLRLSHLFTLGFRIDTEPLHGFIPTACHQDVELRFAPPRLAWRALTATLDLAFEPAIPTDGEQVIQHRCAVTASELPDATEGTALLTILAALEKDKEQPGAWLPDLARLLDEKERSLTLEHIEHMAASRKQLSALAEQKAWLTTQADESRKATEACQAGKAYLEEERAKWERSAKRMSADMEKLLEQRREMDERLIRAAADIQRLEALGEQLRTQRDAQRAKAEAMAATNREQAAELGQARDRLRHASATMEAIAREGVGQKLRRLFRSPRPPSGADNP